MAEFSHVADSLNNTDKPLVYTSMSKHLFYFREQISTYVLQQGAVPLNPFMVFGYFLNDAVERDVIRQANNVLVERADQLWHFGPVSDGALSEILRARDCLKTVRCFSIVASRDITEVTFNDVELEPEVSGQRDRLLALTPDEQQRP